MTEPWQIHTIVFDLDDTLYPEREYVFGGFQAAGEYLQAKHGVTGFAETACRLFADGRRGRIFDEALPLLGLDPDAGLVAELVQAYRAHQPKLNLFPDASETIAWASSRFRLALITDGYADVQARKIAALGLESVMACRIITDELGRAHWKPSPEPFRRVMQQCPRPATGYVYVGDNPRKDFIGARQLGWRTVRVRRPGGEHAGYSPTAAEAAEMEITTLRDLKSLCLPLSTKS